jgi:hypothetical protein
MKAESRMKNAQVVTARRGFQLCSGRATLSQAVPGRQTEITHQSTTRHEECSSLPGRDRRFAAMYPVGE